MRFKIPVTAEILNGVAHVDHFLGTWGDGAVLAEARRDRIATQVVVDSSLASCRLAGIRASKEDIKELLARGSAKTKEGAEILGYMRALRFPYPGAPALLDTRTLRTVHAVIMGAGHDLEPEALPEPTPWREVPMAPEAFDSEGRALGRVFVTLPPRLVPETMENLVTWLELELRSRQQHALLTIGAFTLGVLAATPFQRGNCRLALALANRLLQNAGYSFVPFASLERIFDEHREAFYDAYDASQTRIWTGEADLQPWLGFFLERLRDLCDNVEQVLAAERRVTEFSPLQRDIVRTVRDHGTAEAGTIIRQTGANRNTLKDNLRRLVDRGVLEKMGERRGTRYRIARSMSQRLPRDL